MRSGIFTVTDMFCRLLVIVRDLLKRSIQYGERVETNKIRMKLYASVVTIITFTGRFHGAALQINAPSTDFSSSRRDAFRRMVVAGLVTASAPPALAAEEPLGGSPSSSTTSVVIPGGTAPYRPQGVGSWTDMPELGTKLAKSRMLASELSPLQQAFVGEKELYYPQFMFGAWNVRAELKRKIYPYSIEYLPSKTLLDGR